MIPLTGGFSGVHSPISTRGVIALGPDALRRYRSFQDHSQSLTDDFDREMAEHGLLAPVGRVPTLTSGSPQTLTAWLHVTNACNLDCPYCYVRKTSARMTEEIAELALKRLLAEVAKQGFKQLKIKYAGGEASLHYKLVQHLHNRATELTAQQGIELQEVLLTNGVSISAELADWLAASQVKMMVSLDGIGEKNDVQRPFRDGRPSFSRIEKTIDQVLLPRGIRPDISVTITTLNADGIADVMRWILARELPFSLNFYRENLQSRSRTELQLEEQAIIEGMRAAYKVIEEVMPTRPFFNGLLDRVQGQAHTHTCGVGSGYVVISHEGKLAQCQMHLDHARVNIEDTESLLPIVASGPIKNISVEEKEGCRDCSFKYLCTGGCPIETFRATGRWDVKSPNCNIYKTLLPEAIRLEGLRILKVAGHYQI
ncbi:MAG TPA: radical SAM protein [Blastocatellia bacterium]|nr:radical SAM protein [Blastocatellia bacterium]